MRGFAAMRDNRPDFFIHSGDGIYADCPIEREIKLPDGNVWRNVVTEDKAEVAQTLAQFRGNYKYNLLDHHLLAFNAQVPVLAQWDDHEVTNDWWPGGRIEDSHYTQNSASLLAARGRRAFREYHAGARAADERRPHLSQGRLWSVARCVPDRHAQLSRRQRCSSHGGANAPVDLLGAQQLAWLKRELARSSAVWKVIAADMPIGLVSEDAVALGDGPPHGREREIADLLSFMRVAGVANVVWLTADMHYTAAHHYDPSRAVFQDFDPFYEFVSGPLHAGTWHPAPLDNTFGPRVLFQKGCDATQGENLAPCFGLQFFGRVDIDGESGVMTVSLKNIADQALWSAEHRAETAPRPGAEAVLDQRNMSVMKRLLGLLANPYQEPSPCADWYSAAVLNFFFASMGYAQTDLSDRSRGNPRRLALRFQGGISRPGFRKGHRASP